MVHLFKELHPSDHFEILLPQSLSSNERQLITLFYQPLTGPEPISFYSTLWAEAEYEAKQSMTHYYLMDVLSMPIGQIFQARIALEAIGLLRTYRKDEGESRRFIYELVRPLDADSFFQDPLLSMFLYSKIGEQPYRKLRQRFLNKPNTNGYTEVSRTFMDVFKPVQTNLPQDDLAMEKQPQTKAYPFYFEQFDFELLRAGLSEQLVPNASMTLEARDTIAKLAFMYQLSPIDMQKVVILALDDHLKLSNERLKRAAADYYKLSVSRDVPRFEKIVAKQLQEVSQPQVAISKEQEFINYLETTSPVQFLRDKNNGKEPFTASIQLAEDLVMKHNMPVGVVNVLLEYTMLTTDMKLPRKYVEQIADHWTRKNIKTAKEAMELARQESDKYTQWKKSNEASSKNPNTAQKKTYNRASKGRDEKVPEWFNNRDKQEDPDQSTIDFEMERQKILQQLGQQDG